MITQLPIIHISKSQEQHNELRLVVLSLEKKTAWYCKIEWAKTEGAMKNKPLKRSDVFSRDFSTVFTVVLSISECIPVLFVGLFKAA